MESALASTECVERVCAELACKWHGELPLCRMSCTPLPLRFDARISKKWNGFGAPATARDAREGQKQFEVNQKVLMETTVRLRGTEMKYKALKEVQRQLEADKEAVGIESAALKQRVGLLESQAASAAQLETDKEELKTENAGLKRRVCDLEELSARLRRAAWRIRDGTHPTPTTHPPPLCTQRT